MDDAIMAQEIDKQEGMVIDFGEMNVCALASGRWSKMDVSIRLTLQLQERRRREEKKLKGLRNA